MHVSVVITVFDSHKFLFPLLRELHRQEGGLTTQIIISDDGSDLNTAAPMLSALRDVGLSFERYIWQPKLGFRAARARNAGLQFAIGEVVLFLDGDMIPPRDHVRRHYELA